MTDRRPLTIAFQAAVLAVFFFLAACTDNVWKGDVASINGRSITLIQVSALRNSTYFDWTSSPMAELEVMRKQYGDALTNLLVVELVKQQLEKKKMSVTDEELQAEEDLIRADYPPGQFENMLVSEAIDLETWRFLLRNYLSVQRFLDGVLRPEIVITPEEAKAYRDAHPQEYSYPSWAYFLLVSGGVESDVARCGELLDRTGDPVQVQTEHPEVLIRTGRLDTDRLEPTIAAQILKLRPGDRSPVFALNGEYYQILLLDFRPAREAEPREIYSQVEDILMDQKLHQAYNRWVLNRLSKATIKVSRQLLPHLKTEKLSVSAERGG